MAKTMGEENNIFNGSMELILIDKNQCVKLGNGIADFQFDDRDNERIKPTTGSFSCSFDIEPSEELNCMLRPSDEQEIAQKKGDILIGKIEDYRALVFAKKIDRRERRRREREIRELFRIFDAYCKKHNIDYKFA